MFSEILDFIKSIYETENGPIPLHVPIFNGKEKEYVGDCIDSTFVSSVGKYVDQFERDCALHVGVEHAVATSSGTTALQVALRSSGVKTNDEVITQSLTFVATANAISHLGAHPIFLDVDRDNLSLSPSALEAFLLDNTSLNKEGHCVNKVTKRTIKACIPMHTFGFMAKMGQLKKVCQKFNLCLVEDAAEALGSVYKGKKAGAIGKLGVLSFNGNKILTSGGGGMVLTNDEKLAQYAKHITTTAKTPHAWEFSHDAIAYNYRLPNINAALGVAQMEQLTERLKYKKILFLKYKEFFEKIDFVDIWKGTKDEGPNFWLNTLLFESSSERNSFLTVSNRNNIMTRPIWKPLHQLDIYKSCICGRMENTNFYYERIVNIPSTPILNRKN